MGLPPVLRNRDFNLYWAGVVLSQIGTRATVAANLYHVYHLTGSIAQTGLVGAGQAVALLVLSPLGGVLADRWDRRRLLQASQAMAMAVAGLLAAATLAGHITAWQVVLSVVLTTAAATFDQPARQALIPALVPRTQLPQAFALINPSREVAVLLGPAIAGVLIAVQGPGLVYAVDAVTYAALVVILQLLRVPKLEGSGTAVSVWRQLVDGVAFVRSRRMIWMLMSLDLSATVFGAYRVTLPALCADSLRRRAAGIRAAVGGAVGRGAACHLHDLPRRGPHPAAGPRALGRHRALRVVECLSGPGAPVRDRRAGRLAHRRL